MGVESHSRIQALKFYDYQSEEKKKKKKEKGKGKKRKEREGKRKGKQKEGKREKGKGKREKEREGEKEKRNLRPFIANNKLNNPCPVPKWEESYGVADFPSYWKEGGI